MKTINKPYIKEVNQQGEVTNKIDKHNPYFSQGPSRQARRYYEHGKCFIQRDMNGNEIGRFRKNGSNSKPSSYQPTLNAAINYLLKSLGNNRYLKKYLTNKTSKKLKLN